MVKDESWSPGSESFNSWLNSEKFNDNEFMKNLMDMNHKICV